MAIDRTSGYVSLTDLIPVQQIENSPSSSPDRNQPTSNWHICGGPQTGPEAKRSAVLHNLGEIRQHLMTLRAQNWSAEMLEAIFDAALLPILISAERAHNPENTAILIEDGHEDLNTIDTDQTRQALLKISGSYHYLAADMREVDGHKSIILFDSLPYHPGRSIYEQSELMHMVAPSLGCKDKMSVFCLGLQKSIYDCQIFALNTTTKLAKAPDYLDSLHQAHIREGSEGLAARTGASLIRKEADINVFGTLPTLPPAFLKHAHTRTVLNPAQLDQQVNKSGQSLQQRQQNKMVERTRIRHVNGKAELQWLNFSASIEDKRITYLERMMKYMEDAPPATVEQLATRFDFLSHNKAISSMSGIQPDKRTIGPAEHVSVRLIPAPARPATEHRDLLFSHMQVMLNQLHHND